MKPVGSHVSSASDWSAALLLHCQQEGGLRRAAVRPEGEAANTCVLVPAGPPGLGDQASARVSWIFQLAAQLAHNTNVPPVLLEGSEAALPPAWNYHAAVVWREHDHICYD